MAIEFRCDLLLLTYQQDTSPEVAGSVDRPFNLGLGGAVRTHRIQSYDAWHGRGSGLAGFLDL
jgi:hypothetical protein